jgi:hypothetical protein
MDIFLVSALSWGSDLHYYSEERSQTVITKIAIQKQSRSLNIGNINSTPNKVIRQRN